MPFPRFVLLVLCLLFFLIFGAPLQALLAQCRAPLSNVVPLFFCRTLLRVLRVKIERAGADDWQGPCILAVNHVSWIDILVMGSMTPFCFLAKQEVAGWPVLSAFARVQGTVFIDRTRRRGIPPANRLMAERMAEGRVVLLFPEGTTHDGKQLGPFYSSHFAVARDYLESHAGQEAVAVLPVALSYSQDFAAWVGDEALLPHIWRVLSGAPLTCRVVFAAPVTYTRSSDRKAVTRLVRAAIAGCLGQEAGKPLRERLLNAS